MTELSMDFSFLLDNLKDIQEYRLHTTSKLAHKIHRAQILLDQNCISEAKKIIAVALQECEELIRIG